MEYNPNTITMESKMAQLFTKEENQLMVEGLEKLWNTIYLHNEKVPKQKSKKEMEIIDKLLNQFKK